MNISYFQNVRQKAPSLTLNIDNWLTSIATNEEFKRSTAKVRKAVSDNLSKEEIQNIKLNSCSAVTVSAAFQEQRKANAPFDHSGFIAIDFDNAPAELKEKLKKDQYTYAVFESVSGKGICAIVKIDKKKHLESFMGLGRYYMDTYNVAIDQSCKDVSRARYNSYDPDIFINTNAAKFDLIEKLRKESARREFIPVLNDDVENVIQKIISNGVDITPTYADWLQVGFALADHFGESGRMHYHAISSLNFDYNERKCDVQYNSCLSSKKGGTTIKTLFYYAKNVGIDITSPKTKYVTQISQMGKRQKSDIESIRKQLMTVDNIAGPDVDEIIKQVFESPEAENPDKEVDDVVEIETFLRANYKLKYNEITRDIENEGKALETRDLNSIWINIRKATAKKVPYETVDRIIFSDFVQPYNPIKDYFKKIGKRETNGATQKLISAINTGSKYPNDVAFQLFKKWGIAMIAQIYGGNNPLVLVLAGQTQGTGKTEFFRRMVPDELKKYYAETKFDEGKDDAILMTQNLITMNDELGSLSLQDSKKMKDITSKEWFTIREPYGRKHVKLKRIASICGTTNDIQILDDPTGNRRFLPIPVEAIDFDIFNGVDKEDVFAEFFNWYKDGIDYTLNRDHIKLIEQYTDEFNAPVQEMELFIAMFQHPKNEDYAEYLSNSQIKSYIETKYNTKISAKRLGMVLKKMGFEQKIRRVGTETVRAYAVEKKLN